MKTRQKTIKQFMLLSRWPLAFLLHILLMDVWFIVFKRSALEKGKHKYGYRLVRNNQKRPKIRPFDRMV